MHSGTYSISVMAGGGECADLVGEPAYVHLYYVCDNPSTTNSGSAAYILNLSSR